jgi:hypothetical protein
MFDRRWFDRPLKGLRVIQIPGMLAAVDSGGDQDRSSRILDDAVGHAPNLLSLCV